MFVRTSDPTLPIRVRVKGDRHRMTGDPIAGLDAVASPATMHSGELDSFAQPWAPRMTTSTEGNRSIVEMSTRQPDHHRPRRWSRLGLPFQVVDHVGRGDDGGARPAR